MSKGQPLLTVIVVGVPEIASNVARDRLRSPQITTARSGKPQARSGRPQAARRDTTGVEAGTHEDSLFLQAQFSSALAQLLGNNRFLICLYFSRCLFIFPDFPSTKAEFKIGNTNSSRYIFLRDTSVLSSQQKRNDELRPKKA